MEQLPFIDDLPFKNQKTCDFQEQTVQSAEDPDVSLSAGIRCIHTPSRLLLGNTCPKDLQELSCEMCLKKRAAVFEYV